MAVTAGVLLEARLDKIERPLINDRFVLARHNFLPRPDSSAIYKVTEQTVDVASAQRRTARKVAIGRRPLLCCASLAGLAAERFPEEPPTTMSALRSIRRLVGTSAGSHYPRL